MTYINAYPLCILIWQHREIYAAAEKWLAEYSNGGYFSMDYGCSMVNGETFGRAVCFDNDTDYLIFKLKFPELCL